MEDYGLCCLKPPTLSDCDSDETIVDGSLPGSDEEEDDSHLQRLFVNSSVPLSSPTGGIIERNNNVLGQLSPEILPVGRAITGSFLRKVWGTPQEEETSQSILRNWTKHSSLPEMQAISIRDDTVCEPGLCEDAQHLIHSPACEVPANGEGALTPLPSGTGVKQSSHLQYKVHESREQGELQLSDVKMVNEDYEAKSVNEETQLPDVEIRRNTSGCVVAAEPSVYDLLKPLSPLGNETQMGDEISDQAYLLFIEKPRDDSSELTPELVESINSVLRLEVQSGIEQLQCNIVRDPSDKERQTPVWNVSSLDVTLIPNTAPAQEDSDHMTEEGGCKLSLQNSGQESQTLLPLSVPGSIRYGLTTSRQCCTADLDHDEQIECLHSKKHSTFIVHDQNDDSSQHSPSILANFNLATGGHCSVRSKTAAGSQCIDEKALSDRPQIEQQFQAESPEPENLETMNNAWESSTIPNKRVSGSQDMRINWASRQNGSRKQKSSIFGLRKSVRNQKIIYSRNKCKAIKRKQREASCIRGKYVHETLLRQCRSMNISKKVTSMQWPLPTVPSVKVSDIRRNQVQMPPGNTWSQTMQLQKQVTVLDTTESDTTADTALRTSARIQKKYPSAECKLLATKNAGTGSTSHNQCKQSEKKDLGNIHKRDFLGETKLFRAARKGDLAQVTALIKAGIHVNQQDNAGWTALHEASCKGFCEISLALLEAGADVNRRGLNGTVPIHDAVFGNHFETVRLLLEWGADPYAKDENGENAFDKCCSDKMAELLQSHDHQDTEIGKERVSAETRQQEEVNVKSSPAPDMKRYGTRQQSSMDIITTLQETERKQKRLLTTELHTPEDADKYVEEMRHIQDVLNNVATQQRKERDALAIKYRASVDSFKQGILRDKIANLACRQKSMLQLVHNQRQVAVNIIAYQQMKRSASHHKGKSSSLRYRTASPGKNPKSALLTHNERPGASLPNGSTMATRMPAVCAVPDSESNQFQKTFLSFISSSEISGTREVPVAALASEETGPHSSGLTFDEMPQGTENGLLGTGSCSSFTLTDFNRAVIDHLETDAPGNRSPNSIPACSLLTITENSNRAVNEIIHQASNERQQSTRCQHQEGLYSRKFDRSTADHIVEKGLSMETVTGNSSMEECTSNIHYSQSHGKQQMCVDTERKARMVPWKKLIRMGKLKPGKDVLSFQLQDYSHKVSLLPDGRIRDCSGAVYQDPTQWVKALLGNNISVSWKYVADKITYCGKRLLSFMILEEFAPKETNHPVPENQTSPLPSRHSPIHTALRLKDILLHDKRDFFPSHIMDQIWEEFMNSDRLDL
ncbi:ankyrin repeat domain-containing protein 31 isoform X2 [Hyperolius riggenbachi]|uniref:ankyrin repeat domain-containing protein 31 isoform X2 n=1 Tax=Hyperolius riggenbachi TaxID=752182 RepID=UPI0035A39578